MPGNLCTDTHPGLGAYVRDSFGRLGRVIDVHVGCPEDDEWLALQSYLTDEQKQETVWVSLLVHESGSVVQPASTLERVPPFKLEHTWAAFYFDDARTEEVGT